MKVIRPITMVAAACALSACASLNPFGRGDRDEGPTAPDEGRISILTFEQELSADPQLAERRPALPAPVPLAAWALPGGAADNAPGSIEGPQAPQVLWRRQIVEGSSDRTRLAAPPVIADGRLYALGSDQALVAVDLTDGRQLWRVSLRPRDSRDRNAIGGGVAVSDGRVYAVSGFGIAAALDAATGAELWRAQGQAPFAGAPTVVGGRLFAVTNDSELFAIDANTGDVAWTHQAIAEPARILSASNAAVVGDTVIAPFPSGEVMALLAPNGRRLWVDALSRAGRLTSLSAINDVSGRPVVGEDGVIYAVSHSGVLAAIDQRNGQRRWARGFASTQTPWLAGDTLFAVSVDGELAAFDRASGRAFWVTQLRRYRDEEDRKGRVAWAGPILVGGRLFLANSLGEAVTVDPLTGAVEGRIALGGPVYITPVTAGGVIYVLTDEGRLVALG